MILTADHGEAFLEHGLTQHGGVVYDEVIHVPLIVKFPANSRYARHHGTRVGHRVRHIDLMPTIRDLVGDVELPYPIDGESLIPVLAGAEADPLRRDVVAQLGSYHKGPDGEYAILTRGAILSGTLKLHYGHRFNDSQSPARFPHKAADWVTELYDLVEDPGELRDLASQRPTDVAALFERREAWMRPIGSPVLPADRAHSADRSADLLDRLRELGYLD